MNRLLIFSFFIILAILTSCTHESLITDMPDDPDDPDDPMAHPCDPDTVYFDLQVLPILQSNCAFSGCHDANSASNGIILDSYENVLASDEITAFDLSESKIYEVITETDLDDRMPPPPNAALSSDQINLIATWILQGAQDLTCDEDIGGCQTENMSYELDISPIISSSCQGCHSGGNPSGGILLDSYDNIKMSVDNGSLLGAIKWDDAYTNMPFNQNQLEQCKIDKIESWINDGAPNN